MTRVFLARPNSTRFVSFVIVIAIAALLGGCRSSKQATKGDEGFFVPLKTIERAPAVKANAAVDRPVRSEWDPMADSLVIRQKEQERRLGALTGQLQLLQSARKGKDADSANLSAAKPVPRELPDSRTVLIAYDDVLRSYQTGQYRVAAEGFHSLLKPGIPKDLEDQYHYYLGMSYLNLRQFDSASTSLKNITGRKGSRLRAEAFFGLGQTYKQLGAGRQAKAMFEAVLKESPKSELRVTAEDELKGLAAKK